MTEIPQEEIKAATERVVNETHRKPKRRVVMEGGDTVQIDRYIERYEEVFGGEEVADLAIGGHGEEPHNNHTENFAIINVWDKQNEDYLRQVELARSYGIETSDLLLAHYGKSGLTAISFLSPRKVYTLGRSGNVLWLPFGNYFIDKHWTPFTENNSVSNHQLALTPSENGLVVHQLSKNSKTTLTSAGIRQSTAPVTNL